MKTCTTIHSNRSGFEYGKTHAIRKTTKPTNPADVDYITACGGRYNHLMVAVDKFPVNCKRCLKVHYV